MKEEIEEEIKRLINTVGGYASTSLTLPSGVQVVLIIDTKWYHHQPEIRIAKTKTNNTILKITKSMKFNGVFTWTTPTMNITLRGEYIKPENSRVLMELAQMMLDLFELRFPTGKTEEISQ